MIQKLKRTDDLKYIYKNELDKACFTHDSKDLVVKITISDKILKDGAYEIALTP